MCNIDIYLGTCTCNLIATAGGKIDGGTNQSSDIVEGTEEWTGLKLGPPDHAQYSPSVSHDEEELGEEKEEGGRGEDSISDESWDDLDDKLDAEDAVQQAGMRHVMDETAPDSTNLSQQSSEEKRNSTSGSAISGEFRWGSTWEEGGSHNEAPTSRKAGWSIAGAKPRSASGSSSSSVSKATGSTPNGGLSHIPGSRPKKTTPNLRAGQKGPEIDRGRLSEEDARRLEEQASWSMEPDFFADMAPIIAAPTTKTGPASTQRSGGVEASSPGAESGAGSSTALQYQPPEQENVSTCTTCIYTRMIKSLPRTCCKYSTCRIHTYTHLYM